MDRSEVLREFYLLALDRDTNAAGGISDPWRQNPVDPGTGLHRDVIKGSTPTTIQAHSQGLKRKPAQRVQQPISARLKRQQLTKLGPHSQQDRPSLINSAQSTGSIASGYDEATSAESSTNLNPLEDLAGRNPNRITLDRAITSLGERLHGTAPVRPGLAGPHPSGKLSKYLNGDGVTPELASGQTKCRASQFKEKIEDELSVLRNLNLDLQLKSADACNKQEKYQPTFSAPIEPVAEPIPWRDTLRHNVYYNLEGEGKLSQVDAWSLKSRHGRPSGGVSRKKRRVNVEGTAADAAEEDKQALLGKRSPTLSENEVSTPAMDTPVQISFSPSLSSSRRASFSSPTGPSYSSVFTIALAFGEEARSSLWTRPPSSNASTTSSWLCSDSRPPSRKEDSGRVGKSLNSFEKSRVINSLDRGPRLIQCTFCLEPFKSQGDWEQHEQLQHLPQQEWVCMPWGPTEKMDAQDTCVFCGATDPDASHPEQHDSDPCYDQEVKDRTYLSESDLQEHLRTVHNQPTMSDCMQKWSWPPEDNSWYWNCGFCDRLLTSWTNRIEHIGRHFKKGKTMSSWDPLMTPYPLHKTSLTCISWPPASYWNSKTLLALQREQGSQINRTYDAENQHFCLQCSAELESELELKHHEEIWHLPRDVWSCPTMSDVKAAIHIQTGPLVQYLFPNDEPPTVSDKDACPYCGEPFSDLDDWDARVEHLEIAHSFGKCQTACKFAGTSLAMLHLANAHNVLLGERTAEVVESCRSKEEPPLTVAGKIQAELHESSGSIG